MANTLETVSTESKLVVHNSATDLVDKTPSQAYQGATVGLVAGHANIQEGNHLAKNVTGPIRGDFIYYQGDNKFQLILKSFGKFDNSNVTPVTLGGTIVHGAASGSRNYVAATYASVNATAADGKSLVVEVIVADTNTFTSVKSKTSNFKDTFSASDVLTIAAGQLGTGSVGFTIPIVAADLVAQEKGVATTTL